MLKTAPCYSKKNYYEYFDIDLTNKRVLDIGSSLGSFNKSKKFDASKDRLGTAAIYTTMDINPASGADIIADAHELPFENNSVDLIIANNVIEHFYDPVKAISEMKRVLTEGGFIYFTIPFLYPIHEAPQDYVRLTRFGLHRLLTNFRDVEVFARGGWFSTTAGLTYKMTHVFDKIKLGTTVRALMYPVSWLWVQLDRLDNSDAFARTYFGRAKK